MTSSPKSSRSLVRRVTTVQVQAARLRLVTDRKLGKSSPAWVHKVAAATRR